MINVMILEEAIKKAKKEIVDLLNKIDGQTLQSMVLELRNTLSKLDTEKLSAGDFNQMMASIQEHFLIKLDASISSRADGKDWTADRAGKIDNLDASVSSRLSKVDFDAVLADLKKSSAEYKNRIAAVLSQMNVAGISNETALGLLTQYLEGIPIIGGASSTLTTQGGNYTIPRGYHNGKGVVKTDITNLRPENIKHGTNVGGVVGGYAGPMRTSGSVIKTAIKVPYPKNYTEHRIESNVYQAPEPIQAIYLQWNTWASSNYGVLVLPRISLLVATNLFDEYTIVERTSFWNSSVKIYPIKRNDDYTSVHIYMVNEQSFKVVTTCTKEIKPNPYQAKEGEIDCGTKDNPSDGLTPSKVTATIYY